MVVEIIYAGMVESVDTRDLKSLGSDIVRVQFPFPAPKLISRFNDYRTLLLTIDLVSIVSNN